ncbi:MAG: DUF5723 family protein [Rikenellaceae bacterium]
MKRNLLKLFVLSFIVLTIPLSKTVYAQSLDMAVASGNTLLLGELNPASQMDRSYIVFPLFGNIALNASAPTNLNKAVTTNADGNYLNADKVAKALDKRSMNVNLNMDIISFGVKFKKDHMITFSTKAKVDADAMLPGDAVTFLTSNPLTALNSYNLNLGANAIGYGEVAVGYSYNVWRNLTVGVKFKYLAGFMYAGSDSYADLLLRDDATYDVKGDIDMRLVGVDTENDNDIDIGANSGFGFDFGAEYDFEDLGLKVGLSMTDIGFIKWGSGASTRLLSSDPNGVYHFIGVEDMGQYLEEGSDFQDGLDVLQDDLLNALNVDTIYNSSFKSNLAPKLNIYGSYAIDNARRHNVSLNMITRFNPGKALKNDFAATVGYTYCNKRDNFRALAGYTISNRLGSKFSAGIVTEGRGGEFFFLVDAFPARSVGFRIGGAFYLGRKTVTN